MVWLKNLVLKMKTNSLYLHIPFCEQICAYCDFCKVFYNEHQADDYLAVLKHELQALNITEPLKTIYIGGGTPSSLNDEQLEWLMDIIKTNFACIIDNPLNLYTRMLAINLF